jgi:hypothetical protein
MSLISTLFGQMSAADKTKLDSIPSSSPIITVEGGSTLTSHLALALNSNGNTPVANDIYMATFKDITLGTLLGGSQCGVLFGGGHSNYQWSWESPGVSDSYGNNSNTQYIAQFPGPVFSIEECRILFRYFSIGATFKWEAHIKKSDAPNSYFVKGAGVVGFALFGGSFAAPVSVGIYANDGAARITGYGSHSLYKLGNGHLLEKV